MCARLGHHLQRPDSPLRALLSLSAFLLDSRLHLDPGSVLDIGRACVNVCAAMAEGLCSLRSVLWRMETMANCQSPHVESTDGRGGLGARGIPVAFSTLGTLPRQGR